MRNSYCVYTITNGKAWDWWAPWGWLGGQGSLSYFFSGLGLYNRSRDFSGTICKYWDLFQCSFLFPAPKAVLLLLQSHCMMENCMTGLCQSKCIQFLFQAYTLPHYGQQPRLIEQEKEKIQEESDPFLVHPVSGQYNLGTSWVGSWNQKSSPYSACPDPGCHTLLPSSFLPLHYQASPTLVAFLPASVLPSVL